ncbi:hypothetical protein [Paenibacillus periandrae]|uniref:hypothetical protein n=1 Tax=Paenibacillus periandrae TaxID=1761741 RepID=UPI001F08DC3C|nr:hypothetical protein [Paenibacillus periandrae]
MLHLQAAYFTTIFILSLLGIYLFWKTKAVFSTGRVQTKKGRYTQVQQIVNKRFRDNEVNKIFSVSGLAISSIQYQTIRYLLIFLLLFSNIVTKTMKGGDMTSSLIFVTILFLISSPTLYIFKRKTPFKYLMDILGARFKYKKNLEVYRAVSQLKNLIIIKKERPPGSLYILEQLNKFTKITKPIFNRMLMMWTMGQKEEACKYFIEAMDTDHAQEIGSLFEKLDGLNPVELKNQLILFQEDFKQKRQTEKLKQNQYKSHLIYAVVIISLLAVLTNFLVLGFLMDLLKGFELINQ